MKKNSPLLDKKKLSGSKEQLVQIQNTQKAVDELQSLWVGGGSPILLDVVKKVYSLNILNVPDVLLPIILEKSVGSQFLAQALDSTALQKNTHLT